MSTGWLIVSKQGWSKLSWVPVLSFSNDSCRQQDVIWGCRGQGRSHSFCVIYGFFSATQVLCPWIQNSVGFISTLKGFLNDFSDGSWRIALTRLHCVPWWSISEMACTLTKTLQRCPKVFFLCGACKIRPLQYLNLRMLFSVYAFPSLLNSMNAEWLFPCAGLGKITGVFARNCKWTTKSWYIWPGSVWGQLYRASAIIIKSQNVWPEQTVYYWVRNVTQW